MLLRCRCSDENGIEFMPYKITAKKDDSSLHCERQSLLVVAAKARVWAEAGWEVLVKDEGGNSLDVNAELEKLFAKPAHSID